MISNGSMPGSRWGTRWTKTSMPAPPLAAVSAVAQVMPAPPRSCTPTARFSLEQLEARLDQALLLERVADLHARDASARRPRRRRSRPRPAPRHHRCRPGRWSSPAAPPGCPTPSARPSTRRSVGISPRHSTFTNGLSAKHSSNTVSPPTVGHADRVAVAGDARHDALGDPARAGVVERARAAAGPSTAIGRAPMEKMSRRMPPTPVAAPWYGSIADGWLWLSMRIAAAMPSPTSITPAPSPGPTSTQGASVGKRRRWMRELLYEQCSDHITEYIASSRWLGSRPSRVRIWSNSSSVSPSARCVGSSVAASAISGSYRSATVRPRSGPGGAHDKNNLTKVQCNNGATSCQNCHGGVDWIYGTTRSQEHHP